VALNKKSAQNKNRNSSYSQAAVSRLRGTYP